MFHARLKRASSSYSSQRLRFEEVTALSYPIRIPKRECDLVMKGGVTSGIVYPPAIMVLKKHYVFNSIGGTSAGAVAAAATAAAEYGRSRSDDETGDGFDRLETSLHEFTGDGTLFERFGAPRQTRPVIELLRSVGALGGPKKKSSVAEKLLSGLGSLFRWNSLATVLGLIVGILIGLVLGLALPGFVDDFLNRAGPGTGGPGDLIAPIGIALVVGVIALLTVGRVRDDWWPAAGAGVLTAIAVFLVIALTGLPGILFGLDAWRVGVVVFTTLAVALPGAAVGGLLDLTFASFFRGTKTNMLGIVNGHEAGYDRAKPTRLTDFMYEKLNHIAGMKREDRNWHPLTFGDLSKRKLVIDGAEVTRGIRLEMITTNLSQGIPYRLPFKSDQESYRFIFKEEEFRTLFPDEVVDYMIRQDKRASDHVSGEKQPKAPSLQLPDGYYFLPDPDHLPVVVGMRMSLAIPVFFSVVPLYTVSPRALLRRSRSDQSEREPRPWLLSPYKEDVRDQDLQRHLFSDGGTTSNFPIQLFDKLIPTRPTFGISIASMPEDVEPSKDEGEAVFPSWTVSTIPEQLVDATEEWPAEPVSASVGSEVERVELGAANKLRGIEHRVITSPVSLLSSVVDTARENRETMLAVRPGYRERIVRIRLTQDEGGMNLAMDPDTIKKMIPLGAEAGAKLLWPGMVTSVPQANPDEHKLVKGLFDFDDHRWVRFLISMSQLETELQKFKYAYKLRDYYALLDNDTIRQRPYYRTHEGRWLEQARKNVDVMIGAVDKWPQPVVSSVASAAGSAVVEAAKVAQFGDPTISFYFFNNAPNKEDRLPKPKLALKMNPDF